MRSCRLGWLLVACVATSAHADQTRAEPKPHLERQAKAAKPAAKAEEQRQHVAKASPAKRADRKADEKAKNAAFLELTNDPLTGAADRVEGYERTGMVAFTFDDGPNPETTPAVIDALEKYDVPATFFIITRRLLGKFGTNSREVLARQLAAGFLVASHTVSHRDLKGKGPRLFAKEIDQSIRTLSKVAERPIGMFRAPYGSLDKKGRAWLKKRGLTEVRWSIDTADWQASTPEALRASTMKMILAKDGGVVLMHDVKSLTAQAVPLILDALEAENCTRLTAKRDLIVPVSIHYFLRDGNEPRAIPDAVKKRTAAYRTALPARCKARPKPATAKPAPAKPAPVTPAADKPAPAKPSPAKPATGTPVEAARGEPAEPAGTPAANAPQKTEPAATTP